MIEPVLTDLGDGRFRATADDAGYLFRIDGTIAPDGARSGMITTWRRVGGNRWQARIYDLGGWRDGEDRDG